MVYMAQTLVPGYLQRKADNYIFKVCLVSALARNGYYILTTNESEN